MSKADDFQVYPPMVISPNKNDNIGGIDVVTNPERSGIEVGINLADDKYSDELFNGTR